MQLRSSGFFDGAAIPRRYTCDGEDLSPPLEWSGVPAGTRSFVLLCDDPDAPAGTWHHWAAYDIPADRTGLAEGVAGDLSAKNLKQAINDFHQPGYGALARRAATVSTTITFAYWLFRSTSCRSATSRPAARWSGRRAST